jgi:hypothetical protein
MAGREGGAKTKSWLCLAVNLDSMWVAGEQSRLPSLPVMELALCWWRRRAGLNSPATPGSQIIGLERSSACQPQEGGGQSDIGEGKA